MKGAFLDNLAQHIRRLFHVLAQFAFTKSAVDRGYYQQKVKAQVVE